MPSGERRNRVANPRIIRRVRPMRPEPLPSTGSKWLKHPKRWMIAALVSVILAVFVIFRDVLLLQIFRKEVIGDEVREFQGDSAVRVVRVETLRAGGGTWAIADEYGLSPDEEQEIQDLGDAADDAILAKARKAGSPAPYATWNIFLRGQRNQVVRVYNMRPVSIARSAPFSGTLFYLPGQGGAENHLIGMNMDEIEPRARELVTLGESYGAGTLGGEFFAKKTIGLADQEDQVITFRALSTKYSVSFELEFDYQVGDKSGQIRVTDNGKQFRMTAANCRGGKELNYKRYYSLGESVGPHAYGLFPKSPGDFPLCKQS